MYAVDQGRSATGTPGSIGISRVGRIDVILSVGPAYCFFGAGFAFGFFSDILARSSFKALAMSRTGS